MRYLLLTSVLALLSVCAFVTDLTDEEARPHAISAIEEGAKWAASGNLYVRRREEFEDKIFENQASVNGRISKAIYMFEVSEAGCEPTSGGEKDCSVVNDADPRWYVAVSRSTGNAYRLSGFDDSDQEFNRMAREARLWMEDELAAADLGTLYFTLRFGPDDVEYGPHHSVVADAMDLKHDVESDFYSSYPDGKAPKVFDSWWSGFLKMNPRLELKTKANKTGTGYEVKVPTLEKIGYQLLPKFKLVTQRPVLQERTITVSSDGTVAESSVKDVFPR
jgi:hypothetical protein